jgi:hypothetical protein
VVSQQADSLDSAILRLAAQRARDLSPAEANIAR